MKKITDKISKQKTYKIYDPKDLEKEARLSLAIFISKIDNCLKNLNKVNYFEVKEVESETYSYIIIRDFLKKEEITKHTLVLVNKLRPKGRSFLTNNLLKD